MEPVFVVTGLVGFVFGLLWIVLSVVRGRRDGWVPLPPLVLCGILAWDSLMLFGVTSAWTLTYAFEPFLVAFEVYLFRQFIRYGAKDYPGIPRRLLIASVLAMAVLAVAAFQFVGRALDDSHGVTTGMFLQAATPAACLSMLYRRGSAAGQSVPAAVCLLIALASLGTGAAVAPPDDRYQALHVFLAVTQVLLQACYLWALTVYGRAEREGRPYRPTAVSPAVTSPRVPSEASEASGKSKASKTSKTSKTSETPVESHS
ncbi:hypothetical protein [Streptomyces sp. TRM68416]|uniref:transmembrane-type terpene cyclase n=1 Tax=Streptomyces sp. TRM68416 TaxID=2758412 RepID=UPI0016619313|nr:hypothetical protein [Streptomyces sp. TRM68416]MBD0844322.1 hypothetical protein [Streptomyces sp. TRM68416]